MSNIQNTINQAQELDLTDPVSSLRDQFLFPDYVKGTTPLYFCGNSLGLQPKNVKHEIDALMQNWKELAVLGHHKGNSPWIDYHKSLAEDSQELFGGSSSEICYMNTLTVNLHLLLVSFYLPTTKKYKIIAEKGMFPSDQYAFQSQLNVHARTLGDHVKNGLIELSPREGEDTLRTEDILATIDQNESELALVVLGGINYYTGQLYDMETIAKHCNEKSITIGYDLAHVAGNVPVQLHDWGVDFACWCTYKYMNSGPGGPSGVFVHEKHHTRNLPRFAGWWGYHHDTRFLMKPEFVPENGAEGWQLSNPSIFSLAPLKASIQQFKQMGAQNLRERSKRLTAFLDQQISSSEIIQSDISIITPSDPMQRGAQLSLRTKIGQSLYLEMEKQGLIADWREPDVIRVAPTPLYNTFEDIVLFTDLLESTIKSING